MDYTRVAPRFRRLACAFQVALVLALILYAAFQVGSIVTYSENPPVNTEMLPWNGAGRWAMCSWGTEHFGLTLSHVGMSIANHTGISMPDGSHRDNFSLMTSWTLSATRLELHGEMRNCSIVDLDNWEWGALPQLWTLFANIGGYVTLLSLLFTTVFVKANPNSEISRVYDARTFIGERIGFALPNGQPDQLRDAE
ncbi:unnamed protein product [Symbiodinium sp. CCMP2456]|nr:unnamed protein product [Symbiodinium sp. CCMP2456]